MAKTHKGHTSEAPVEGKFYNPQDGFVNQLNVVVNGEQFPLKKFMVELCYYEDLFGFCSSGYVYLRDAVGLIEKLKLTGKEPIIIEFGKSYGKDSVFVIMRLYKIGTRTPTGDMTSEFYKLYFCSEELLLSEQKKISKSFKNQPISQIVKSVLTDTLKCSEARVGTIESTVGVYDFIVPNLRPFETISWLSTYARPNKDKLTGADMLIYENRFGFNFSSINTLMKQTPYRTYKYEQNNLKNEKQEELTAVLQYEVVKSSDTLKEITDGVYANKVIAVDPLRRRCETYRFDYMDYVNDDEPMNGEIIPSSYKNRDGKTNNEEYESCIRVVYGTSQQNEIEAIKAADGSVTKDMYESAVLSHRTAQLALANHTVVKLLVPGDPTMTVGKTVNFNVRSIEPDDSRPQDGVISGKYLVTAVRHILQSQGVFQTVLEITKNGTIAKMD